MPHALSLPHLLVEQNRWVYSATVRVLNATVAVVYRSGWLRDSSPKLAPVFEFLKAHDAHAIEGFTEETPELVNNRAKVAVYEVLDAAPAPGTPEFSSVDGALDWVRNWVLTGTRTLEAAA